MEPKKLKETITVKRKCTIWTKRTLIEKHLLLICFFLFIAFLISMGLLIHVKHSNRKVLEKNVCLTNACKMEAGRLLENMDFSIDPCENFYEFSCGSFLKYKTVFNNKIDSLRDVGDFQYQLAKEVLEKPGEEGEPKFYEKVRTYYQSCLKRSKISKEIIEEFLEKTKLKQWPILYGYNSTLSLETIMATEVILGDVRSLATIRVSETLIMYTGRTMLKEKFLINTTKVENIQIMEQYKSLIGYVLNIMGLPEETIVKERNELVSFETALANITSKEWAYNKTMITTDELEESCNLINWKTIIATIYDMFGHREDYNGNITIKIGNIEYIRELCHLIDISDSRVVRNYVIWCFLLKYLSEFDDYVHDLLRTDNYSIWIPIEITDLKWKYCVKNLKMSVVTYGLDYMTIKSLPSGEMIEEVKNYVNDIKQTAEDIFLKQDWIDAKSQEILKTKLNNIAFQIGYSNTSLDIVLLNRLLLDEVNITEDHLDNLLKCNRLKIYAKLFNDSAAYTLNKMEIRRPLDTGAYYVPRENFTANGVVALGLMFPPFYTQGVPKYVNYAGIGCVIGHELSHGFQALGKNSRDCKSNEAEEFTDLPEELQEKFKIKFNCLMDQYSVFLLEGNLTVNGNKTICDNFADNSGLAQALLAYEKQIEDEEPQLPGLDFTNIQMFFLKYAELWCEHVESFKESYEHDSHSPGKYRALIPLMNLPQFSEAFNCPLNSFMNPEERCQIWE